jgi:hypothetical protein
MVCKMAVLKRFQESGGNAGKSTPSGMKPERSLFRVHSTYHKKHRWLRGILSPHSRVFKTCPQQYPQHPRRKWAPYLELRVTARAFTKQNPAFGSIPHGGAELGIGREATNTRKKSFPAIDGK